MSTPPDQANALISQLGSFQPRIPSYTPPDTSKIDTQISEDQAKAQGAETQLESLEQEKAQLSDATAGGLQQYQAQMDALLQQYPAQQVFQATAMHSAPIIGILAALGGKAAGISGQAMLGAMNGMAQGINEGAQQQYEQQLAKWKAELAAVKDRHELQMEIYQTMLTAYSGRADAAQKARDFALASTRDHMDAKEAQVKDSIDIFKARVTALNDADKLSLALDRIGVQLAGLQNKQNQQNPTLSPAAQGLYDAGLKNGTIKMETPMKGLAPRLEELAKKHPGEDPEKVMGAVRTGKLDMAAATTEVKAAAGQAGKTSVAENEILKFGPLVLEASSALPRGSFMPFNHLLVAADYQLSDPALRKLKARITPFLNAFDQLAARGGTDKDKRAEQRAQLLAADSPQAVKIAVDTVVLEARKAKESAKESVDEFTGKASSSSSSSSSSSAPAKASSPPPGDVHVNGKVYRVIDGNVFEVSGG